MRANQQLRTLSKTLFNANGADFVNPKKRPDVVVVGNRFFSITGIQSFEKEISELRKVLIIELKRGGFEIGREERNQAQGYVEDLLNMGEISQSLSVIAFVVGNTIAEKASSIIKIKEDRGIVIPITFSQLVDTAERRMFGLRKLLEDKCSDQNIDDFIKERFAPLENK